MADLETKVAVLDERTEHIMARQESLEKDVSKKMDSMEGKLDKLSDTLSTTLKNWNSRPSWFMTIIMTSVFSLLVSLIVFLITGS